MSNALSNSGFNPDPNLSGGRVFVITGPSGVGKGTLCKRLLGKRLLADKPLSHGGGKLRWSISATTRAMRPSEVHGEDYYFLSPDEFQQKIDAGEMLEWAAYNGHYYGTPKHGIQEILREGHDVLLEIEVQGALNVAKAFPQACLIFVLPPSMSELEARLIQRGTNDAADIQERLAIAQQEIEMGQTNPVFQYRVVNQSLDETEGQLKAIIQQWNQWVSV